ncbi:MAG: glycosyltransferase family 4 protein [Planctomycetes bacterium]|nr:glycosyltransferase family 4 protein [Planctomycetota bacterium]
MSPKSYPLFNPAVKGVVGGSEIDLYFLSTELAQDDGFEVSMVVADYGQEPEEQWERVRVIKSLDFRQNSMTGGRRIWRALERADAQVYVIKTFSAGMVLTGWYCGRKKRKFIYRTAHRYDCDGTYRQRKPLLGWAFDRTLRRAEIVLAQNKTDGALLAERVRITPRVIPNGHRLEQMDEKDRELILWVGRSAEFKRPDVFIELARQNPEENFCMICQRATEDENYSELVKQAGEVENLEFISSAPFGEIDRYFQRAKVFVNTSEAEGFPNTFIQACKCGTPILSLQVNPDGFLDKHGCGVCVAGDKKLFEEKLHYLMQAEMGGEYGGKGRRYVEEHHDISKIVEQYKIIFRELVSG